MSAAALQAELQQIFQLAADARSTSYSAVAALTVLVLDHVMTLPFEIRFVWNTKWSAANILYLWNRYFSLAVIIIIAYFDVHEPPQKDIVCEVFIQFQGVAGTVIVALVDLVLLIRVYVLYGRSKKILLFLSALVSCEIIPMAVISVFSDLKLDAYAHFGPQFVGCYSLAVPRFLSFYNVPALFASLVMFLMTLHKCGFDFLAGDKYQPPVVKLFARDGIVWFSVVLILGIVNIVIWAGLRPTLAEVNIAMSCAVYSIIASRVLMNIKTTLRGGVDLSTATLETYTMSNMSSPVYFQQHNLSRS